MGEGGGSPKYKPHREMLPSGYTFDLRTINGAKIGDFQKFFIIRVLNLCEKICETSAQNHD